MNTGAPALLRAGKDHEFLPFSGFTHMVPDPLVTTRLNERIVGFLRRHLQPGRPVH
jgi:dipeptidyl-peptidase-4